MKVLVITLALAGIAATAPLDAQITIRNEASQRDGRTSVSSSWYAVGRDGNGNAIYERQIRDRNGNTVIQRARRDRNGNMVVVSSRTVRRNDDRNRRNCDYDRSTNSLGDILFGRSNDRVCDDEYSREDGGWYQVGRGRDNRSIYERRTRDRHGDLIIQRARRNSDGRLTIISTRRANSNDRQWKRDQKERRKAAQRDGRWDRDRDWERDHDDDDDDDDDDNRRRGRDRDDD